MAIWKENGALTVHFTDDNGTDTEDLFRYELEYVYLPPEMIPIRGHVSGVGARGDDSATIDLGPVLTGPTVLRGFDLVFLKEENDWGDDKEDTEIREIGVRTPGNRVEVIFSNDKRSAFDWGVDWVHCHGFRWSSPIRREPVESGELMRSFGPGCSGAWSSRPSRW